MVQLAIAPSVLLFMALLNAGVQSAPVIQRLVWGSIEVSGMDSRYKDAKVWPGGSRAWDWRETGTRHNPGVQVADVSDLFEKNGGHLDALVISRGMQSALQVPQDTIRYAEQRGAQVFALPTEEAVAKYNELVAKGVAVAGVFHSTC